MFKKVKQTVNNLKYLHQDRRIIRSVLKVLSYNPPLSFLINRNIYNYLYNLKIKSQGNPSLSQATIIIETTNLCNASCVMCSYSIMKRKKGIMSEDLFRKIVSEAKQFKVKRFTLSGIGEPLLDPNLTKRIKFLKSQIKNSKIRIFTNASLLNKERAKSLAESGIDEVIISFNGYKSSYEKVMKLNFEQTVNNINYFLEKKPKKLPVHLSCMYVNENAKDIKKINKLWDDDIDLIAIKMPENWAGGKNINTPFSLPYPIKKWPCKGIFDSFNIYWDGKVVLCCRDYDAQLVVGNVNKETIQKVWAGNKLKIIRQKHLRGNFDEIPICKNCDTPILNAISWW